MRGNKSRLFHPHPGLLPSRAKVKNNFLEVPLIPWWSVFGSHQQDVPSTKERYRFMARIIPFRGIRYSFTSPSKLSKVVAPPYDIINTAQKRQLLAADPDNVIRLIIGNPSHEKHASRDYQNAKRLLTYGAKKIF